LAEQRADLRHTIAERCEMAAQLVNAHNRPAVAWCNLNEEGNRLEKLINGAVQVSGSDSEERKEEVFQGFINGKIRVLVTKPTIGGFGLNLQHCAHETFFPSHSYEQYYQAVKRSNRYGATKPLNVHIPVTEIERPMIETVLSKAKRVQQDTDEQEAIFKQCKEGLSHVA
jgi:superfamily II DNA helicase RecQ